MATERLTINDLYSEMFEAIKMLKEEEINVQQATAIAKIGTVIVNAAKTELQFMKLTDSTKSTFLPDEKTREQMELEAKKALPENRKYFKTENQ